MFHTPAAGDGDDARYDDDNQWGAVAFNDSSNANGQNGGPSGDSDYTGATIHAATYIMNMSRGTGGGAGHFMLWGKWDGSGNADITTGADLNPSQSLATYTVFTTGGNIPGVTDFAVMGFEHSGGSGQNFECQEMWVEIGYVPAVADVETDEFQGLSDPVLPGSQQPPGAFTIDPETLDDPLRDEIQWFQPLAEPVLPKQPEPPGKFVDDPELLGAKQRATLQWWRNFDIPIWPALRARPGWIATDSETLGDPLRDEIQWFEPLSSPILARQTGPWTWIAGDLVEPAAAPTDESGWFVDLSVPVLPRPVQHTGAVTDPETLGAIRRIRKHHLQPHLIILVVPRARVSNVDC